MSFKWPEVLPTENKDAFTFLSSQEVNSWISSLASRVELFTCLNADSEVTTTIVWDKKRKKILDNFCMNLVLVCSPLFFSCFLGHR